MKASIIIPTFQGAGRMTAILETVANQKHTDFECIVVIDGSTDETAAIVNSWERKMAVTAVVQTNRGRAGARNAGARVAIGDLLLFYDDDMLLSPDSVEKHLLFHRANPGSIVVGNAPQKISDTDFNQYRTALSREWVSHFAENPERMVKGNLFMTAANCSIDKAVFHNLGGFDERLRDAEDKEFGVRAFQASIPIYFDKHNIAWHNESVTCRSYVKRLRQYATANEMVGKMHREFVPPRNVASPLRKFLYRQFASSFWVDAIDQQKLKVLPRSVRYKIYAAVTFALSEIYPAVPF